MSSIFDVSAPGCVLTDVRKLAEKFELGLVDYPGSEQIVELPRASADNKL